jgi:hypothetical protein
MSVSILGVALHITIRPNKKHEENGRSSPIFSRVRE